jgi:hypothetical protein
VPLQLIRTINVLLLQDQRNAGCPWPDTGDGVLDKDDKCPEVKGTVANKGCPEVSEAVMMKLNEYSRTILFDSGKHLSKETYPTLLSITEILKNILIQDF